MTPTKHWIYSKTVWANVLSTTAAVILLVGQSPSFTPYTEWLLLMQGVLNIVLRAITHEGLSLKP